MKLVYSELVLIALQKAFSLHCIISILEWFAMSDDQFIPALLQLASDSDQLVAAQHVAAKKLLDYDGEIYPSDGCAITLSVLLQEAGIGVADTYRAIVLGDTLRTKRNWKVVPVGQQKAGDVGSTCGSKPNHGTDHIYLVLKVLNSDEMVVADNQEAAPHFRYASGAGGKSPTKFFLRAQASTARAKQPRTAKAAGSSKIETRKAKRRTSAKRAKSA